MTPEQLSHLKNCPICYKLVGQRIADQNDLARPTAFEVLNATLKNPSMIHLIGPKDSAVWAYNRAVKPL